MRGYLRALRERLPDEYEAFKQFRSDYAPGVRVQLREDSEFTKPPLNWRTGTVLGRSTLHVSRTVHVRWDAPGPHNAWWHNAADLKPIPARPKPA